MIGDFIIMFRRLYKQHVTCRHEYKRKWGHDIVADYWQCIKCDKTEGILIK